MEVRHCDICGEVIKQTVYIISILKSNYKPQDLDSLETMSTTQFMGKLNERKKQVKVKEICPACVKVWEHLTKIRLRELKKIQKEILKIEQASQKPVKGKRKKKEKE